MTRRRFLIDPPEHDAGVFTLAQETAHHVRAVLRLQLGDTIELRDGRGHAWDAVLVETAGRHVRVAVTAKSLPAQSESPLRLTLALAFSRMDRMELAVRQATELGVHRFLAFPAERSEYRLSALQTAKRKERWRRIAGEALCQCGRVSLPGIDICADLSELATDACVSPGASERVLKVLARENGERLSLPSLFESCRVCTEMIVVVGPEGGWTQNEGERFLMAGFRPVHLGPRTLRLETAAVALLAAVQVLWGDLGTDPASAAGKTLPEVTIHSPLS